jgi:hypothetical protein
VRRVDVEGRFLADEIATGGDRSAGGAVGGAVRELVGPYESTPPGLPVPLWAKGSRHRPSSAALATPPSNEPSPSVRRPGSAAAQRLSNGFYSDPVERDK